MGRAEAHGRAIGQWGSLRPQDAVPLLTPVSVPWWIAGGWALDLFLGDHTRVHEDLDVGILRRDFDNVVSHLCGWDLFEAHSQTLYRLEPGERPRAEVNSVWCRRTPAERWALELMLDESQDESWVFRRLNSIRLPLDRVIRRTSEGIPYLSPEVQLLYKARHPRAKDHDDFENVLSRLGSGERAWLRDALSAIDPEHVWLTELGA